MASNRPWCGSLWIVLAYFTDPCLHSFRGQRLRYIISSIQLPAISWMPFSSDVLRCALCTLPFHIISWHFHPSTGNVSNFVWTHQNTYSSLSFLSLWYQRTFEISSTLSEWSLYSSIKETLPVLLRPYVGGLRNPTRYSHEVKVPDPKSTPAKIRESCWLWAEASVKEIA